MLIYLKTIFLALFSRDLYRDVASKWLGMGLMYIFFITCLISLFLSFKVNMTIDEIFKFEAGMEKEFLPKRISAIIEQIPEIKISGGKFITESDKPTYISFPESPEKTIIIIDTKNQIQDLENTDALIFIQQRGIAIKEGKLMQALSVKEILQIMGAQPNHEMIIKRDDLLSWARQSMEQSKIVPMIFFLWKTITSTIQYTFQALIMGFVGLAFCQIFRIKPQMSMLARLSAVALTPVMLLEAITLLTGTAIFAYPHFVYLTIHAMYLFYAIESLRNSNIIKAQKNEKI